MANTNGILASGIQVGALVPCEKFELYVAYHLNGSPSTPPEDGWENNIWQCEFCAEAKFWDYNEACEHEKICEKNTNTVVHDPFGKQFIHKMTEITGDTSI